MREYKRYLMIWDMIHIMNVNGIYTYGYADQRDGQPIIAFETEDQKNRYQLIFKED